MRMPLQLVLLSLVGFIPALIQAELRDPTRPVWGQYASADAEIATVSIEQAVLQAIYYHPDKAGALINGRRYAIGDSVANYTIHAIHADKVILADETGEKTLKLVTSVVTRHNELSSPAGKD